MFCKQCGSKLENGVAFCPFCGTKIADNAAKAAGQNSVVKIACPVFPGQVFNNACIAYNDETGAELARCKQGETLILNLKKPTSVKVIVKGSFGQPVQIMSPGDNFKIGYRGFGKIYLAKVDAIY